MVNDYEIVKYVWNYQSLMRIQLCCEIVLAGGI